MLNFQVLKFCKPARRPIRRHFNQSSLHWKSAQIQKRPEGAGFSFQNWGRLGPIHRGPSYLAPLKYSIFYRSIINISGFREIKPLLDQGPAVWCVRIPTDWLNNMICESGNTGASSDKKVDTDDSGEWVWIRREEIRPIHRGPTTIWRASIHAD